MDGTPPTSLTESQAAQREQDDQTYIQFMKPKFSRAPIKEAGRVAYLGESSNLTLLVHDRHGHADVVHYPLPENVRGSRARLTELDNVEIDILHQRGAFLLPQRTLCDELLKHISNGLPQLYQSSTAIDSCDSTEMRRIPHPCCCYRLYCLLVLGSAITLS